MEEDGEHEGDNDKDKDEEEEEEEEEEEGGDVCQSQGANWVASFISCRLGTRRDDVVDLGVFVEIDVQCFVMLPAGVFTKTRSFG